MLHQRGVIVVPDILASAGGVTVSYFEWVQNHQQLSWDLDDVHLRLRTRMRDAATAVCDEAAERERQLAPRRLSPGHGQGEGHVLHRRVLRRRVGQGHPYLALTP